MAVTITPSLRSVSAGAAAAVVLIGAFALGVSRGGASSGGPGSAGGRVGVQLTSVSSDARITVTGTGTVSGTPNQLTLSMGVQVTAATPCARSAAVSQVTAALRAQGVAAADIQTSG